MLNTNQDTMARARELFINLTDDVALVAKVAHFGYTLPRLQEGHALLQAAEEQHQAHQAAHALQLQATEAMRQARSEAHTRYTLHVTEARRAFRNDRDAYSTLGLAGERKKRFNEWVEQAAMFYARLLSTPAYQQRMAQFNTELAALQRGAQLVDAARNAKAEQDRQITAARALSRARRQAHQSLRTWLQTFVRHARLALAATPEDLRALGLAPNLTRQRHGNGDEPSADMRQVGATEQWI